MISLQHHNGVIAREMSTPFWGMGDPHQSGAESGMASTNNIRAFREQRGWSRPQLASLMKTSPQQVEKLEKGERSLRPEWIDKAAAAFGVTPADIITPGAELASEDTADRPLDMKRAPDIMPSRSVTADDGTVELTALDLSYSMGPGTELASYIEETSLRFDPEFLRRISRAPYHRLRLARGVGDSMQPTLLPGDVVMIDTTQTKLSMQDRVWAVALNGAAAIKRLRMEAGNRIVVISDNPTVPAQEVDPEDVVIHGRVIWFGREL